MRRRRRCRPSAAERFDPDSRTRRRPVPSGSGLSAAPARTPAHRRAGRRQPESRRWRGVESSTGQDSRGAPLSDGVVLRPAASVKTWPAAGLRRLPTSHNDPSMASATGPNEPPPTILESALRYDRAPAVALLIVLPVLCWIWIVVMARDMYGPMTGASAWMMTAVWDPGHLALLWAMWAVMMAAMMMPSASPMLLFYGAVARRSEAATTAARQIYAFAAGYLVVWALFSLAA